MLAVASRVLDDQSVAQLRDLLARHEPTDTDEELTQLPDDATPEQIEWRRPPTERHISAEAKAGLNAFARSLPEDSPLRASLERLVKRGKD